MHQNLTATPSAKEFDRPDLYINRELSWVEFNRRVFGEAKDCRHPLLERVKFVSIFDSNLDEYIMIRLAGLKDQLAAHVISLSPDGLTAEEQLAVVRELQAPLIQRSEEHTSELQSPCNLVCRLLLEKKKPNHT